VKSIVLVLIGPFIEYFIFSSSLVLLENVFFNLNFTLLSSSGLRELALNHENWLLKARRAHYFEEILSGARNRCLRRSSLLLDKLLLHVTGSILHAVLLGNQCARLGLSLIVYGRAGASILLVGELQLLLGELGLSLLRLQRAIE